MTSDSSTVKKKRRRRTKVLYVRRRRCLAFPLDTQTDPGIGCAFSLKNRALWCELDAERKASAIAANEAMAMIARLHEEKSLLDLASRQYKRLAEEREAHHRETISLLKELLLHRDRDRDSENHHHHHFHHFDYCQHHPHHHCHPHRHTKDWLVQTDDYTALPPSCSSCSYSFSSSCCCSSSSSDIGDDDIVVRDLADSFASAEAPDRTEKASAESGSVFLSESGKVALIDEKTRAQDMKDSSVELSRTGMAPLQQQQQSVILRLFKDFISLIGHLCQKRVRRLCQKDREPPWSYKGNGGFPCTLEMQNISRKK